MGVQVVIGELVSSHLERPLSGAADEIQMADRKPMCETTVDPVVRSAALQISDTSSRRYDRQNGQGELAEQECHQTCIPVCQDDGCHD